MYLVHVLYYTSVCTVIFSFGTFFSEKKSLKRIGLEDKLSKAKLQLQPCNKKTKWSQLNPILKKKCFIIYIYWKALLWSIQLKKFRISFFWWLIIFWDTLAKILFEFVPTLVFQIYLFCSLLPVPTFITLVSIFLRKKMNFDAFYVRISIIGWHVVFSSFTGYLYFFL